MSVFKIQQQGVRTQASDDSNSNQLESSPQALQDQKLIDEISGKSVSGSVEHVSTGANANVIDPGTGTASEVPGGVLDAMAKEGTPDQPVIPEEKAGVLIKIDGPVGRVFTDALNTVLANESYMTMVPESETESEGSEGRITTQVYCWKADELLLEDVVAITNDISRHTERDYVIVAETSGKVSRELGLMEDIAKLKNVKLCFSQEAAIDVVLRKLA